MKPWTLQRLLITLLLSLLVWAILAMVCLMLGSTGTFGWPSDRFVLAERWKVVSMASIVGAGLASAGVVYQALLRNPLAEPYLLGVSSGASLMSFVWTLPAVTSALTFGGTHIGQQTAAFVGALGSMLLVFGLASRRGSLEPVSLLLVGVIVNSINGAIFLLLISIVKDPATPGGPIAFLIGGLQTGAEKQQVIIAGGIVLICWVSLLVQCGRLNAAMLSDAEASSLGVNVHLLRWTGLLLASLITAAAVAISGPIGFIGLVCPHLARLIVGNDQRKLLPVATALGAGLLALADRLAAAMVAWHWLETVVPVGVLTALLGGPFFLLILLKSQRRGEI